MARNTSSSSPNHAKNAMNARNASSSPHNRAIRRPAARSILLSFK
eukprot:CAMPEP_0172486132 /NCGR_PEP_ID=MMETSP1066-20121228/14571_1 /TAXON_ID=671091 /ORGANISM="Coscinodiscus wailesii, Strain CCMP2513" /LENGTH=44 /DNA_ID= /DNA_START= /DNA_END= /DNA_ORIENTATION=